MAQTLARQSAITLTMDRCAHVPSFDQRAALDKLPELPRVNPDTEALKATRTADATPNLFSSAYRT